MTNTSDSRNTRLIVIGLMIGLLLSALDQTIVSTAMPTVINKLHGFNLYSWVFSIYMLTSTAAVPIFGKLADLYGRRPVYLVGMGFFILGSALCGLSHNMVELIIFRGIQGIGAGALMPLAMTIIGDIYPPDKRGKMQGIFGAVFGLSSILGPGAGGFIVDHWDWQWIFYVNLPFGIIAAIILGIALKETRSKEKRSIDWFGALTLTGAIVAILLGLVLAGNTDQPGTHYAWASPQIIGLFSIGAILIGAFLLIEARAKEPIIPLTLFKNRVITVVSIAGFFMGTGMFGAITYIPLFVQGVVGTKAATAGYILTPLMLSLILASIIGGRIISKLTYRTIIMTSMAIMGLGFYLMSTMTVDTTNLTVILYMIVTGLGMGSLMPTFTIAVQSAVGPEMRGVATSSSQFFRSIGGTMGVSIMGAIMASKMASGLSDASKKLTDFSPEELLKYSNPQSLLSEETRASMPPQIFTAVREVLANAVDGIFVTGVIFVAVGVIAAIFLGKSRLQKSDSGAANGKNEKFEVEVDMM
ncbi:DHA2 family efflux MFS transporter permease subunit [Paenibacillus psychroresistens]|uniref:DHA2 family efflux MFS transporter permease subunit n=1 Tax=Paenibacillus psychroresistens TaxID=1778678 RepID=A0A6B8RQA8_9BACL|nr:MDR family MFS transporter [Paenibacillus psychroresistens]QGQ97478.1 DHA2 family efflux MFS transporter permease subunit [Paenibacillus psychroresistens]